MTAFSSSSQLLAIAGIDFKIRVLDIKSRELISTLDGHSCAIAALEFSPSDAKLVSIDFTGKAIVRTHRPNGMETIYLHPSAGGPLARVVEVAFSSDESMLAYTCSGDSDRMKDLGYLWSLETNTLLRTFNAWKTSGRERSLSFSDDGRYLRTFGRTIDLKPLRSPCLDPGQPLEFSQWELDGWIRWHGRMVLRRPDDWYHVNYDSRGNKLAMVNDKGEVAFLKFDPQELRKALGI